MIDYFQAIILAIVEGITEFLPISSTGHLVLTADLLKITQTEFVKSFEIFIQLGAILAVVVLYWPTLLKNRAVWERIIAAFLPTAFLGLIFYKIVKGVLLGNTIVTLAALFLGGIVLIFLEYFYREKEIEKQRDKEIKGKREKETEEGGEREKEVERMRDRVGEIEGMSLKSAFLIGIFQSISMIPGVSRAAATIFGGIFLGLDRKTAVEFSFLLAIPTMLAATSLDLVKSNLLFNPQQISLLAIGFIGSFLVAMLVVKLFLHYLQKNILAVFGIYRILLAAIFWLIMVK